MKRNLSSLSQSHIDNTFLFDGIKFGFNHCLCLYRGVICWGNDDTNTNAGIAKGTGIGDTSSRSSGNIVDHRIEIVFV